MDKAAIWIISGCREVSIDGQQVEGIARSASEFDALLGADADLERVFDFGHFSH